MQDGKFCHIIDLKTGMLNGKEDNCVNPNGCSPPIPCFNMENNEKWLNTEAKSMDCMILRNEGRINYHDENVTINADVVTKGILFSLLVVLSVVGFTVSALMCARLGLCGVDDRTSEEESAETVDDDKL